MSHKWYVNRLKSMSISEILCYRSTQWLVRKLILRKWLVFAPSPRIRLREEFNNPVYAKEELQLLFKNRPWKNDYSFFKAKIRLNENIEWRKDYNSEKVSSIRFFSSIDRQDFSKVGDIKYVSESNRMHFLPFLAFHYVNCNATEILDNILLLLKTWEDQNPFLKSINYTSGIEVGIRSLNIIYTHLILKSFDALTKDLDTAIKKLIYNNYIFLKSNLSLFSSANNHLVAELMGLAVISSYFKGPNLDQKKWEHKFIKLLKTKYNSDGIDDELSTRYHLTVTDHFLNGIMFLQRSGRIIDEKTLETFGKSFRYIEHIRMNGAETYFGDNDDSFLINPFFVDNFNLADSLIDSSLFFYKNSNVNPLDFRNYLIFGSEYFKGQKQKQTLPQSTFFKESGYVFSYNHNANLKLAFDCGRIGDNRLKAHGHSDQLSFVLQMNGFKYIVDPGTYQYHNQKEKWRNYFRGIKAHNTISVNGHEQARSLGRMGWTKASKVTKTEFQTTEEIDTILGQIDGFRHQGVIHTRTLTHHKTNKSILVKDHLEIIDNKIPKKISFFLHFNPDAKVESNKNTIVVVSPLEEQISISNRLFGMAKLIRGNEELPFGWFSNHYDNLEESTSLLLEFTINTNTEIQTKINY